MTLISRQALMGKIVSALRTKESAATG